MGSPIRVFREIFINLSGLRSGLPAIWTHFVLNKSATGLYRRLRTTDLYYSCIPIGAVQYKPCKSETRSD